MGTNVVLGAAVVAAGLEDADGAEVAAGLLRVAVGLLTVAVGLLTVATGALADDVLAPQADSASPTPRPSAKVPEILVIRGKYRKLIVSLIVATDQI
jgi:hypothetical protein